MPDMTLAHAAQVFQEMVFHTIPTRAEDKALALRAGQRKIYERRCPTAQEVHAWWTQDPGYNVALLLGPACRLLVLNVNQKGGFDGLGTLTSRGHVIRDDLTPKILTPHGGAAYCFKPPEREQFPFPFKTHIRVPDYPGIELRGTGGYQLVPPSSVKATTRDPAGDYRFAMPWTLTALFTECPQASPTHPGRICGLKPTHSRHHVHTPLKPQDSNVHISGRVGVAYAMPSQGPHSHPIGLNPTLLL